MRQFNFSFINLGCNKNLVDTQFFLGNIFSIAGNNPNYKINYIIDPYDNKVEYVFLNTCGFISSGRLEMFEEINKLLNAGKKIYLLGCALQYFEQLTCQSELKNIILNETQGSAHSQSGKESINYNLDSSAIASEGHKRSEIIRNPKIHKISRSDWNNITIEQILNGFDSKEYGESPIFNGIRAYTNIDYGFEYLKIAEGCNNHCTFCIIPKIRGKQKSLPMEEVIKQAKELIDNGTKEIILLAQDTNRYGIDLYGKPMLFELLENLEKIDGDFMYRVLYLYPDVLTLKQLEKLKKLKKFIPYFDIPLQHINPEILKRMGRFYDKNHILKLLDFINKNFDEKFVRTNIIVGFPGETEKEFNELCDFLKNYHFDNIALFEYHDEPLAESSKLDGKVDEQEIHKRFEVLKGIIEKSPLNPLFKKEETNQTKTPSFSKRGKGGDFIGFIMGFEGNENNPTIVVRPRLHAPEIDEYDKIKLEDIEGIFYEDKNLDIGCKILYKK